MRSAGRGVGDKATYTLSGDPIAGLAINADGRPASVPRMRARYLAVGEEVITVNYRVTDPDLNGASRQLVRGRRQPRSR